MCELTIQQAGVTSIAPSDQAEAVRDLIRHYCDDRRLSPRDRRKAVVIADAAMRAGDSGATAYRKARQYLADKVDGNNGGHAA